MDQGSQQPEGPALLMAPFAINTFGWAYDPALTQDENYNDLALVASRSSTCDGGHMGTVLVSKGGAVVAMAVNSTLYDPTGFKSDVHAEANCLCACARHGVPTEGSTIYITMPPCKACFGLLQAAGVRRIVFRRQNRQEDMNEAAKRLGIEMVGGTGHAAEDASQERVKALGANVPRRPKRQKLADGTAAAEDSPAPAAASEAEAQRLNAQAGAGPARQEQGVMEVAAGSEPAKI